MEFDRPSPRENVLDLQRQLIVVFFNGRNRKFPQTLDISTLKEQTIRLHRNACSKSSGDAMTCPARTGISYEYQKSCGGS